MFYGSFLPRGFGGEKTPERRSKNSLKMTLKRKKGLKLLSRVKRILGIYDLEMLRGYSDRYLMFNSFSPLFVVFWVIQNRS